MKPDRSARRPAWLQILEHTADVGLQVQGANQKQLFERAAWGMFALLGDPRRAVPAEPVAVSVVAPDREALLVRWLSELNFLHQTRHMIFCRFEIETIDDTRLTAQALGERIAPRHRVASEIKAVTFHGLRVTHNAEGWQAGVIFDV
jgi:SHS2 domain-containing protein